MHASVALLIVFLKTWADLSAGSTYPAGSHVSSRREARNKLIRASRLPLDTKSAAYFICVQDLRDTEVKKVCGVRGGFSNGSF